MGAVVLSQPIGTSTCLLSHARHAYVVPINSSSRHPQSNLIVEPVAWRPNQNLRSYPPASFCCVCQSSRPHPRPRPRQSGVVTDFAAVRLCLYGCHRQGGPFVGKVIVIIADVVVFRRENFHPRGCGCAIAGAVVSIVRSFSAKACGGVVMEWLEARGRGRPRGQRWPSTFTETWRRRTCRKGI